MNTQAAWAYDYLFWKHPRFSKTTNKIKQQACEVQKLCLKEKILVK